MKYLHDFYLFSAHSNRPTLGRGWPTLDQPPIHMIWVAHGAASYKTQYHSRKRLVLLTLVFSHRRTFRCNRMGINVFFPLYGLVIHADAAAMPDGIRWYELFPSFHAAFCASMLITSGINFLSIQLYYSLIMFWLAGSIIYQADWLCDPNKHPGRSGTAQTGFMVPRRHLSLLHNSTRRS